MITITLTYRNRDLAIVKKCFNSLKNQTNKKYLVKIVNYGSSDEFNEGLKALVSNYAFIELINVPASNELWCKSKAINISLKQSATPYFFVGDIDMIFHPEFVEKLYALKKAKTVTYFQVGFLSQSESKNDKNFEDYIINFKSTEGATGMTFFNTEDLIFVNGYDEFYNGWGSEDTDVHERLKNSGRLINFFDNEVLFLHQWHSKNYRTKNSLEPFHSGLEQINNDYLELSKKTKKIKANLNFEFGVDNSSLYKDLNNFDEEFFLTNKASLIKAFIYNVMLSQKNIIIKVCIKEDENYKSIKQLTKKVLGKKTIKYSSMETVNNMLLETIINSLRNCPYRYQYNQNTREIDLTIKL